MSLTKPSTCPKCTFPTSPGFDSCPKCGVIFAKYRERPAATGDLYSPPPPLAAQASTGGLPDVYDPSFHTRPAGTSMAKRISQTSEEDGDTGGVWKNLGWGLLMAVVGLYSFHEFATLEAQGGEIRINVWVLAIYKIAGKYGVLAFFLFGAAVAGWRALKALEQR